LIAINGLYRHGFLLAPTLASEVMNYLQRGVSALNYPQLWNTAA
jgi:glycine oxidase